MSDDTESSDSSAPTSNPDQNLKTDINKCLSTLKSVKFGFIELGEHCNAANSKPFTSACCDIRNIKDNSVPKKHYTLNSERLFTKAIASLKDFSEGKQHRNKQIVAAMQKLRKFYNDKGKNLFSNRTFTLTMVLNFKNQINLVCSLNSFLNVISLIENEIMKLRMKMPKIIANHVGTEQ